MSKQQLFAVQRITNRAQHFATMLQEPAMIWTLTQLNDKTIELRGSNVECERRWFDEFRRLQAFIGPRGRVVLSSATSPLYNNCK